MGWGEESLTGLRMASWRLDWCQQRSPHYYALPNLARPVLVGNYGLKLPPAVLRLGSVRRGGSARGVIGGRPQLPPSAGWRPLASGTSHPLPSNPKTHLGEMLVAARGRRQGNTARPLFRALLRVAPGDPVSLSVVPGTGIYLPPAMSLREIGIRG
jgi:hypothetical protein